jgi:prepilin-type N-terminal cleavage/methylation domain-containing protein
LRRGFSLIEVLVAVVLLGIGVVGSLQALASINRTEVNVRESQRTQQLAHQKLDELIATDEIQNAPLDGTFEDDGSPNLEWTLETEPSEVEALLIVRLGVSKAGDDENRSFTVTTLLYDVGQAAGATAP